MNLLCQEAIIKNQGFGYVLSSNIQSMILENRSLIQELKNANLSTDEECIQCVKTLKRYNWVQGGLHRFLPIEIIERFNHKARSRKIIKKLIKNNNNYVEILNNFDYTDNEQCLNAKKIYSKYKRVHNFVQQYTNAQTLQFRVGGAKANMRIKMIKSQSCELCNSPLTKILQIHHITPRSHGGTNDENNLCVLCPTCHCVVHNSIDNKKIEKSVLEYYSSIENADKKLLEYVKMGMKN